MPTELKLLYQAHNFAKQLEESLAQKDRETKKYIERADMVRSYNIGFTESLKQGKIAPWARTIIDHFRQGSVGGAHYRFLAGGNAA